VLGRLASTLPFDWAGVIVRDGQGGRLGFLLDASRWGWGRRSRRNPSAPARAPIFDLPGGSRGVAPSPRLGTPAHGAPRRERLRTGALPSSSSRAGPRGPHCSSRSASRRPFRPRGRALLESMATFAGTRAGRFGSGSARSRAGSWTARASSPRSPRSAAPPARPFRYEEMAQVLMNPLHALTDLDLAAVIVDLPGLRDLSLHCPAARLRRRADRGGRGRARGLPAAGGTAPRGWGGFASARSMRTKRTLRSWEAGFASRESAPLLRRGSVVGAIVVLRPPRRGLPGVARAPACHTIASQASLTLDRLRNASRGRGNAPAFDHRLECRTGSS
jgi:hypothetical protein